MIACFVFTIVVFRSEVLVLFAPLLLEKLLRKEISFEKSVLYGIFWGVVSLSATVLIDSYFWGRWLWPEGEVLWFNTVLNKSHQWGVSPYYWYFVNALPRALLGALPLMIVGIAYDFRRERRILTPVVCFLMLYSFLPHKELRFVWYSVPIFNVVAAVGFNRLLNNKDKGGLYKLAYFAGVGLLIASALASCFLLTISYWNYPGGYALQTLHKVEKNAVNPFVHVDVFAAMTGVSRFGEKESGWKYSKEENLHSFEKFTHLITEKASVKGFKKIGEVAGYDGLSWWNLTNPIRTSTKIFIHKKK